MKIKTIRFCFYQHLIAIKELGGWQPVAAALSHFSNLGVFCFLSVYYPLFYPHLFLLLMWDAAKYWIPSLRSIKFYSSYFGHCPSFLSCIYKFISQKQNFVYLFYYNSYISHHHKFSQIMLLASTWALLSQPVYNFCFFTLGKPATSKEDRISHCQLFFVTWKNSISDYF